MGLTTLWRNIHVAVAILGSVPCLSRAPAAESSPGARPVLRVPLTDSKPAVDGKINEPCWRDAARTGPLKVIGGKPAKSTTEAFVLRDADHLYVGVICADKGAATEVDPGHTSSFTPGKIAMHANVELDKLIRAHWGANPPSPRRKWNSSSC